ncbi:MULTISPECIES: DUF2809 domain-containing protein [unclassified Shewanella]|uniref:ribosomal maturation YjgA family protein n=1 Tax=unclassified Shewanella TaxID=196818 RepID=UPI0021D9F78E|nr:MULTISPECIES: DUF2809 domain-containing protein [unclassified Shewanella]MCU8009663.1 DUF2809 domain-containing protein [Shewanella sp. SM87]MCU8076059.1 DUF2809 domain-containing protein [Shewanella sp. SM29]MCU8089801.1 DUF2809 domain-containing protein [Shewanella sp. SM21]
MSTAVMRAFISRNSSRKSFCIYAVLLFLTEVLIALYAPAGFIRGFVGDVLVVILLFCMVRVVVPPVVNLVANSKDEGIKRFFQTPWLALAVLLFAFAIEFGQYWGLVDKLGLGGNRLARIVIGSHFDPLDLVAYFVGYLILLGCYWKSRQS